MELYLLILGISIMMIGYFIMIICYFKYSRIQSSNMNGFDAAKRVSDNYNDINIIESDSFISYYHLKRKVVRLTGRVYHSDNYFSLGISSMLASFYTVKKNVLSNVIPVLTFIDFSSIIMGIVSYFMYSKGDARIGILLCLVILVYQYFYLQICMEGIEKATRKLKHQQNIVDVMVMVYKVNKMFFISNLVFLLRFVVIIL